MNTKVCSTLANQQRAVTDIFLPLRANICGEASAHLYGKEQSF